MTRRTLTSLSLLVALVLSACSPGPQALDSGAITLAPVAGSVTAIVRALSAEFPVAVDPNSVTSASFTLHDGTGAVAGTVAYDVDSRVLSFTPTAPLPADRTFTATVSKALKFLSNHVLTEDLVWTFDTKNDGVSVALGASTFTYSGAPQAVAVTTTPAGIAYDLTYSQNGVAVAAPTNAGTYDVAVRVTEEGHEGAASGKLIIEPAPLTITARDASKGYDGSPYTGFEVAYAGFVGGQDESVLGGSLAFGGSAVTAVDVGEYEITAAGLTSKNYAIAYVAGTLEIEKSGNVLTVTAQPAHKVYDGVPYAGAYSVSYGGFVDGDDESALGGKLTFGGAAMDAVDAGEHDIVPAGLESANYEIKYVAGSLTIEKAALLVTADDQAKVYDANPFGAFSVTYDGFVGSEDESLLTGELAFGASASEAVTVGDYAIVPSGLSATNYDVSFAAGTLTIDPAELTVTVQNAQKVYDGAPYAGFAYSISGFVAGEDDSVMTGTPSFGEAGTAYRTGSYPIVLSGLSAPNYVLVQVPATLTIAPREPVTYSHTNVAGTFGEDTWIEAGFGFDISDGDKYEVVATLATHGNNGDQTQTPAPIRNLQVEADGLVRFQPGFFEDWEKFVFVTINVFELGDLVAAAQWWFHSH